MRKVLIILFLAISSVLSATNYYVKMEAVMLPPVLPMQQPGHIIPG